MIERAKCQIQKQALSVSQLAGPATGTAKPVVMDFVTQIPYMIEFLFKRVQSVHAFVPESTRYFLSKPPNRLLCGKCGWLRAGQYN
jgi:ribosomal protein S27AE